MTAHDGGLLIARSRLERARAKAQAFEAGYKQGPVAARPQPRSQPPPDAAVPEGCVALRPAEVAPPSRLASLSAPTPPASGSRLALRFAEAALPSRPTPPLQDSKPFAEAIESGYREGGSSSQPLASSAVVPGSRVALWPAEATPPASARLATRASRAATVCSETKERLRRAQVAETRAVSAESEATAVVAELERERAAHKVSLDSHKELLGVLRQLAESDALRAAPEREDILRLCAADAANDPASFNPHSRAEPWTRQLCASPSCAVQ